MYKSTIIYKKNNRRKRKKILEKDNMITIKTRKKITNNQWIENISTIKKLKYSNKNIERKNYVFTVKKKHQVKKCRFLQNQVQKSVKTQIWVTTITELCEWEWCQKMSYQQYHLKQNMIKNCLWMNKKTKWESSVQSWNKNNSRYQKHDNLHWTICYKKNCMMHKSEKQEKYYF